MPATAAGAIEMRASPRPSRPSAPLVASTPEDDLCIPAARAIVAAGLHSVLLPDPVGGLDAGLSDAARMHRSDRRARRVDGTRAGHAHAGRRRSDARGYVVARIARTIAGRDCSAALS